MGGSAGPGNVGAQVLGFVDVAQCELTLGSELCPVEEEA